MPNCSWYFAFVFQPSTSLLNHTPLLDKEIHGPKEGRGGNRLEVCVQACPTPVPVFFSLQEASQRGKTWKVGVTAVGQESCGANKRTVGAALAHSCTSRTRHPCILVVGTELIDW